MICQPCSEQFLWDYTFTWTYIISKINIQPWKWANTMANNRKFWGSVMSQYHNRAMERGTFGLGSLWVRKRRKLVIHFSGEYTVSSNELNSHINSWCRPRLVLTSSKINQKRELYYKNSKGKFIFNAFSCFQMWYLSSAVKHVSCLLNSMGRNVKDHYWQRLMT